MESINPIAFAISLGSFSIVIAIGLGSANITNAIKEQSKTIESKNNR